MNGDLSRASFDPSRYSRVVAQQGRAQLDSDWNEQQAITEYRLRVLASDVFGDAARDGAAGAAVVPAARAGFGVHVHAGGRFDGVRSHEDWIASEWSGGRDPFTICAWIAPEREPKADGTFGTVVAHRGAYAVAVGKDRRVAFERAEHGASVPASLTSRAALRTDGFSFVACVFTGDALEIWIDGELAGRGGAGPGPWLNAPLRIGAAFGEADAANDGFLGTIEHVFIRRRRMLQHEIAAAVVHSAPEHVREHGSHWVFSEDHGVEVRAAERRLCAGPGRAYVGGRLCENAHHTAVEKPEPGEHVAYLDVWERYVSAFEDASIREPALGGVDTTGRIRTVARVRLTAADSEMPPPAQQPPDAGQIAVDAGPALAHDNLLYRFEIHAPANASDAGTVEVKIDEPSPPRTDGLRTLTVTGEPVAWSSGQFLVPAGGSAPALRVVSPNGGAEGRAFIVDGATQDTPPVLQVRPAAALLWSKYNGHVVFALEDAPPAGAQSDAPPADTRSDAQHTSFALEVEDQAGRAGLISIDDVVVLTDEERIDRGDPGFLTTIVSVSTERLGFVDVVVAGRIPPLGPGATLRRWDGVLSAVAAADKAVDTAVEAGDLRVRFAPGGTYRAGDFWLAKLRPNAPEQIDWPTDATGKGAFVPPAGTPHDYALLAAVRVDDDGPHVERDLRHVVHSVRDLALRTDDLALRTDELMRDVAAEIERAVERTMERVIEREREWHRQFEHWEHERHEHEQRERERWEREQRERERWEHEQRERWEREHDRHDDHEHEHRAQLVLARTPPHGYVPTGGVVDAAVEHPAWRALEHAPDSGAADAVTVDGCVYVLFATGSLLRWDPHDPDQPWSVLAPHFRPRREYGVTAADGRLLVVGGIDASGTPSASVDAYDPRNNVWLESWSTMRVARAQPIVASAGDTMIVCGGICRSPFGRRYVTQTAEVYDANAETWRMLEPMPFRRYGAAAACAGGSLYVAGGALATSLLDRVRRTARVDRMNLRTGSWAEHTPLDDVRFGARAAAAGDEIIVLGGAADAGAAGERVSIRGDGVRRLPWPGRERAGVTAAGGAIYAVAGVREGEQLSGAQACTLIDRMHVYRRRTEPKET